MNTTELKDYFRSQVRDTVQPYLWTDEEVMEYMNDAQTMFCRLASFMIADATSDITQIAISTGEPYSDIHPSIITIRSAMLVSNRRKLDIVSPEDLDRVVRTDYNYYTRLLDDLTPGPVTAMVIGIEPGLVRWARIPEFDDTVELSLYRKPREALTAEEQEIEIPAEHHIHFIPWMKHLAYSKQDADTFDPKASEIGAAQFTAYCEQSRREWELYRHKPRSVMYGGL